MSSNWTDSPLGRTVHTSVLFSIPFLGSPNYGSMDEKEVIQKETKRKESNSSWMEC